MYGRFDLFFEYVEKWLDTPWPAQDPQTVELPSATAASLTAGDVDWYKVVIPSPVEGESDDGEQAGSGFLDAHTTGTTNTRGYLFEATANGEYGYKGLHDEDSGQGDNFRLVRPVTEGITYFLAVTSETSADSGDYTLNVRYSELHPDDDHAGTDGRCHRYRPARRYPWSR